MSSVSKNSQSSLAITKLSLKRFDYCKFNTWGSLGQEGDKTPNGIGCLTSASFIGAGGGEQAEDEGPFFLQASNSSIQQHGIFVGQSIPPANTDYLAIRGGESWKMSIDFAVGWPSWPAGIRQNVFIGAWTPPYTLLPGTGIEPQNICVGFGLYIDDNTNWKIMWASQSGVVNSIDTGIDAGTDRKVYNIYTDGAEYIFKISDKNRNILYAHTLNSGIFDSSTFLSAGYINQWNTTPGDTAYSRIFKIYLGFSNDGISWG